MYIYIYNNENNPLLGSDRSDGRTRRNCKERNNSVEMWSRHEILQVKNRGTLCRNGYKHTFITSWTESLKNRINVVVTTRAGKMVEKYGWDSDIHFVDESGISALIEESPDSKFFIIGGKQIYNKFLKYCSKIWVSVINSNCDCDLFLDYDFSNHRKTVYFSDDEFTILCYEK